MKKLLIAFMLLTSGVQAQQTPTDSTKAKHQCIGITKKGERCKHLVKANQKYCFQHLKHGSN